MATTSDDDRTRLTGTGEPPGGAAGVGWSAPGEPAPTPAEPATVPAPEPAPEQAPEQLDGNGSGSLEPAPYPPGGLEPAGPTARRDTFGPSTVVKRTRISGTWVAVVVAAFVLVFLLIFILQNQDHATVRFLGFAGTLPLGVAMLFATIAGALIVALIGTARILQLRRRVRRIGT